MTYSLNSVYVSPPAEGVTMFVTAGIDEASIFLQQLDDVLVSILQKNNKTTDIIYTKQKAP